MHLKHVYMNNIPDKKHLDEGVVYISRKYDLAIHLCPCGCGEEVVIPISKNGWSLTEENGLITLHPSILNRFECKSHYYIRDSKVDSIH